MITKPSRDLAAWDQSEKFVKLYLTNWKGLDTIPPDDIKLDFTNESVRVRVGPVWEGSVNKIFEFSINKTCHKINPDKSHYKVKSDYLLVFLAKHNPGSDWSHITFAEKVNSEGRIADELLR